MSSRSAETVDLVLSTIQDGRTRDLRYRQRQLRSLHAWITGHVADIETGVQKTDHLSRPETRLLTILSLSRLREVYDALDLKTELADEYRIKNGQDHAGRQVPEELTYVVPERRLLFYNIMSILYVCIAAGSSVIVELPGDLGDAGNLVQSVFREALDKTAFVTLHHRGPADLLSCCLVVDQTGLVSTAGVGRLIGSEIGAATVAIVDRTADLDFAAQEIVKSRVAFAGKGAYAPGYILVNEFSETRFLDLVCKYADEVSTPSLNGTDSTPINRPSDAEKEKGQQEGKVVFESPAFRLIKLSDRSSLWDSRPARSIAFLASSSHEDAIDAVNAGGQKALLALYVFADPSAAKYLTQFVRTRVSFVNYIPTQILAWPAAPAGYPVSPDFLYTRAMIESASPQYLRPKEADLGLEEMKQETSTVWEARSNYAAIKANGLKVSSSVLGDLYSKPRVVQRVVEAVAAHPNEPFDYVVVCTKATASVTATVIEQMRPALTPQRTAIVLIQNGLGVEEAFHKAFPETTVISGVAYVPTTQISPGVFVHSEVEVLHLGLYPSAPASAQLKTFAELIRRGRATARVHDDIQTERWAKIVANGTVNPICALSRCRDRELVEIPGSGLALFQGVMQEIACVAARAGYGHVVTPALVQAQLGRTLSRTSPGVQPSMMADALEGRPMEVQAVVGEVVRIAEEKSVDIPRLATLHVLLTGLDKALQRGKDV
ncbi:hypothetical protein CLAIMM_06193 [Cladophialophora immunda]|nr:hypothetical protein CLAIMM_06193 [Cladophialophora immunda]